MIKITPDIPGRIKVTFPYNPGIVARIRTVKTRRWLPEEKYWSFFRSEPVIQEIVSTLSGEKIDIDASLGISVKGPLDRWRGLR
jgi:hypothetical protein